MCAVKKAQESVYHHNHKKKEKKHSYSTHIYCRQNHRENNQEQVKQVYLKVLALQQQVLSCPRVDLLYFCRLEAASKLFCSSFSVWTPLLVFMAHVLSSLPLPHHPL